MPRVYRPPAPAPAPQPVRNRKVLRPARQHPGDHQARHTPFGAPRRRQAHLGPHLRGDARRPQ
eukprot:5778261-Prymnesium_polylepis.1